MAGLMKDTSFGHLIRLLTNNRCFKFEEEKDLSLWKKYLNEDKSAFVAHHGTTEPPDQSPDTTAVDLRAEGLGGARTRDTNHTPVCIEADENEDRKEQSHSDSSPRSLRPEVTDWKTYPKYNKASGVKIDPEKGRDLYIVDWWGDDDPENPINWSQTKKFFVTFEICLLTTSVYIGSAIYTAGIEGVMQQFGVSEVAATLGLTVFVLGYGIGPMLWSPMSEIPQLGRNPIYMGTLLLFIVLQLPVIFAANFGMLLAFRFITGFIGSPVLATGGASLADMYTPRKRAYSIAIWGISAVCGPVMGPLVGGFAAQYVDWTWTIWELMWLSSGAFIFLFFFFPETSASNILYRRARRLRKITGNNKLVCQPELDSEYMTGKTIALMVLVRPFTLNFLEPMVLALNTYIALIYGLLYVWFESFPIVFGEIYGFSLSLEGVSFLGILIGAVVVLPPFFFYLYKVVEPQFNDQGELKPEKRMPPACVGGFAIVICLFWFGWSAGNTHWIMPIIGSAFFSVGAVLLFNSVLNYLPDAYPDYAASVLAGNDFMRSSFGAGFPLFATAMYEDLGVGWASSTLGFLALAFVPIPFVLYRYGETLRIHYSKHARKDF